MPPTELSLSLKPRSRYDAIDVAGRVTDEYGDVLRRHRRALYCSFHTTAGYLEQSMAARLQHSRERLDPFIRIFQRLFPPNADYRHDQMHLRTELTDEERRVEPRNADSHLTFIGAGLRNCATYVNHADQPVYFIELDGTNGEFVRTRSTTVLAYDDEETCETLTIEIPISRHPVDSINLADPKLGVLERINEVLPRQGVRKGRVDISLDGSESHAGLTVNEYETLLMRNDLAEVVRDPLKFAAESGMRLLRLRDPRALALKSLDYAKYDLVHVFNEVMEAVRINESAIENILSRFIAFPARRFLRLKRSVSMLVTDRGAGQSSVVGGKYQSPILVQWQPSEHQVRRLLVTVKSFR